MCLNDCHISVRTRDGPTTASEPYLAATYFVYKAVSEHSHACVLTVCGRFPPAAAGLSSRDRDLMATESKTSISCLAL